MHSGNTADINVHKIQAFESELKLTQVLFVKMARRPTHAASNPRHYVECKNSIVC